MICTLQPTLREATFTIELHLLPARKHDDDHAMLVKAAGNIETLSPVLFARDMLDFRLLVCYRHFSTDLLVAGKHPSVPGQTD